MKGIDSLQQTLIFLSLYFCNLSNSNSKVKQSDCKDVEIEDLSLRQRLISFTRQGFISLDDLCILLFLHFYFYGKHYVRYIGLYSILIIL